MHEYIGYLEVCYGSVHVLIQSSSRDVIDDCSTILLYSEAGNLGTEGINGYGELGEFIPQESKDRCEALSLLLATDLLCSGP